MRVARPLPRSGSRLAARPPLPFERRRPAAALAAASPFSSVPAWFAAPCPLMETVDGPEAVAALLARTPAGVTLALEWLSPTCKHCEAAAALVKSAAEAFAEPPPDGGGGGAAPAAARHPTGARLAFARCLASGPAGRAAAEAAGVRAFPLLQLYRGGALLLELTPSQRGGSDLAAARLRALLHTVAAEARGPEAVHFVAVAGEAAVREGPALGPPRGFSYAAAREAALAQLRRQGEDEARAAAAAEAAAAAAAAPGGGAAAAASAAAAAGGAGEEDPCTSGPDDEECDIKW